MMNVIAAMILSLSAESTIPELEYQIDEYGRSRVAAYQTKQFKLEDVSKSCLFIEILTGSGTITQKNRSENPCTIIVVDHSKFRGTIEHATLEENNLKLRFIEDLSLKMTQKADGIHLDFADGIKPTDFPEKYQPRLLSSDDLKSPFTDLGLFNPARPLPLPNPPSRAIFFKLKYGE